MTLYKWSQIAATDAAADPSINWAEGMSPAGVNDSGRAMMAAIAKYRDDTGGANNGTGGTSTAYTLTSNQGFDSTAHMAAQELTIYPNVTNGANPTLNVDGLGAFPIVTDGALTPVPTGTLIAGGSYILAFSYATSTWRLKCFYVKPWEIPVGSSLDYWGPVAPNSSFALMYGQAISRTVYSALFALLGTQFGAGDGTTTFNLPDLRGRVVAGKGNMGGAGDANLLNASYFGADGTVLGAVGGSQSHTLTLGETPAGITSGGGISGTASKVGKVIITQGTGAALVNGAPGGTGNTAPQVGTADQTASLDVSGAAAVTSNNTGGNPHAIVQPTIIGNKIMRII